MYVYESDVMTQDMATRDVIWVRVLSRLVADPDEGFFISDILLDAESDKEATARRVLRSMESIGLLQRTSKQGRKWHKGPLGDVLLNEVREGKPAPDSLHEVLDRLEELRTE
jgi:hypothetical protein